MGEEVQDTEHGLLLIFKITVKPIGRTSEAYTIAPPAFLALADCMS